MEKQPKPRQPKKVVAAAVPDEGEALKINVYARNAGRASSQLAQMPGSVQPVAEKPPITADILPPTRDAVAVAAVNSATLPVGHRTSMRRAGFYQRLRQRIIYYRARLRSWLLAYRERLTRPPVPPESGKE